MRINHFFQNELGVKLKNPRWSWGALDLVHSRVFLRIWRDQIKRYGGGQRVEVFWKKQNVSKAGWNERSQHLEAIKNGAEGIGIICKPHSSGARRITGFQDSPLVHLGKFTEDNDHIYADIAGYFPISELARISTLTQDVEAILSKKIAATTKELLVNARLGQGEFRANVLRLWNDRCSVTGSSTKEAIRASHIKPWKDSTNSERLNPKNGLPLAASLDALFDAGLISFEASGRMIVSSRLSQHERKIYGVVGKMLRKKPPIETADFLLYHRTNRYQK